jgi:hypothetical protein
MRCGEGGVVGFLGHIHAAEHLSVTSPMNQRLAISRKVRQDLLVSTWREAVRFKLIAVSCSFGYCAYLIVLAMASFERTRTWGALELCDWGIAAIAKPAIAPGRNARQYVEPPNWK